MDTDTVDPPIPGLLSVKATPPDSPVQIRHVRPFVSKHSQPHTSPQMALNVWKSELLTHLQASLVQELLQEISRYTPHTHTMYVCVL